MRYFALVVVLIAAIFGCDRTSTTKSKATSTTKPDNTAVNARDRDANAKTPIDQNENKTDVDITADIRKQVVDTEMSVDAQNVKIITQDGKVTLRGPVKTAEEKKQIEAIASTVAGTGQVVSELEVK
jgi:hyperosmotically inducible periplasmic protein